MTGISFHVVHVDGGPDAPAKGIHWTRGTTIGVLFPSKLHAKGSCVICERARQAKGTPTCEGCARIVWPPVASV